MRSTIPLCLIALLAGGCAPPALKTDRPEPKKAEPQAPAAPDLEKLPRLSRDDFNRIAGLLDLPFFWSRDSENQKKLDPAELTILGVGTRREHYIQEGKFTPSFWRIYRSMIERRRREAVARELNQGRPTLVHTDFQGAPERDRVIVRHITAAARIIEELYALQEGSFGLRNCLLPDDPQSQALGATRRPGARRLRPRTIPSATPARTSPKRPRDCTPPNCSRIQTCARSSPPSFWIPSWWCAARPKSRRRCPTPRNGARG
jgi:hypothetical protein